MGLLGHGGARDGARRAARVGVYRGDGEFRAVGCRFGGVEEGEGVRSRITGMDSLCVSEEEMTDNLMVWLL